MNEEVKKEINLILNLLKGSLTQNEVSMGFDNETESLMFFDTQIYIKERRFDGFRVKLEELVRWLGMNILRLLIGLFTGIGIVVVLCIIEQIVINIKNEIKDYRANKTRIKCLCRPHVYALHSIWAGEEAEFICTKCGKEKRLIIEPKSFYEFFRKKESEQNEINRCN